MNLAVFERKLPLRAYPEKDLNKILITVFVPWLCKLLSLKDEVSADRLEMALPAIKVQCIGMGFDEVKKMFESYVDGHLPLEPRTNFFDRVLLGKIVKEWKTLQHKKNPLKNKLILHSESELFIINNGILKRFLHKYDKNPFIEDDVFYIYDILDKRNLTNSSLEYKESIKKDALYLLEKEISTKVATNMDEQKQFKRDLLAIKKGNFRDLKRKCKILALEEFFRNLYRDKDKLKEFKNSLL
jgi:hypothetical protein